MRAGYIDENAQILGLERGLTSPQDIRDRQEHIDVFQHKLVGLHPKNIVFQPPHKMFMCLILGRKGKSDPYKYSRGELAAEEKDYPKRAIVGNKKFGLRAY